MRTLGEYASRLLKKTHMLRCRSIASLQRTVSTPPLVDFSRASPLDLFEQPARGFFQHPARTRTHFFSFSRMGEAGRVSLALLHWLWWREKGGTSGAAVRS